MDLMVVGGVNLMVVGRMNPMEIGGMNPMEVSAMNPMVTGGMNPKEVDAMNPIEVSAMNPMVIEGMNPTVRKAIDALQRGDVRVWLSLFVKNAVLYDHGNAMTAGEFIEKSAGREYFTRIDRTDDMGMSVFGSYHTVQWGDFLIGFRFGMVGEEDTHDRICRLDVSETFVEAASPRFS